MSGSPPDDGVGRPRYRSVRLCSSGGGFEAIPERRAALDLGSIAERLRTTGLGVVDARVMLIVATVPELTLSRDGRILVKTSDAARAEALVRELWDRVGAAALPPG